MGSEGRVYGGPEFRRAGVPEGRRPDAGAIAGAGHTHPEVGTAISFRTGRASFRENLRGWLRPVTSRGGDFLGDIDGFVGGEKLFVYRKTGRRSL
jgi:hypothetical protein